MREIILDTETTGTDPLKGDRIIEIGCVELVNHIPTGNHLQFYINPEYPVSEGAFKVHGLSNDFLKDKPVFAAIVEEFEAFIKGAKLVIHNAPFDIGFLNMELSRLKRKTLALNEVIDTLSLARRKHPGASNSLDALCTRYAIDNSKRALHGALLDVYILSEVYIELIGGKQTALALPAEVSASPSQTAKSAQTLQRQPSTQSRLTDEERERHKVFIESMGEKGVWRRYIQA